MKTPTLQGLTSDPRYISLDWDKKKTALSRFGEEHPDDRMPLFTEIERLKHYSNDGTVPEREFSSKILDARIDQLRRMTKGEVGEVDETFETKVAAAKKEYEEAQATREEHLSIAADILQLESDTGVGGYAGVVGDVALPMIRRVTDPVKGISEAVSNRRDRSNKHLEISKKRRELSQLGYSDEDVSVLLRDASINMDGGGSVAAVDSYGNIGINNRALFKDFAGVEEAVKNLDAPSSVKKATLESLSTRKAAIVNGLANAAAEEGYMTFDVDSDGNRVGPFIRPPLEAIEWTKSIGSAIKDQLGFKNNDIQRRHDLMSESRILKDGVDFTYEEKEKAVSDFLDTREGFFDRLRIGINAGLFKDVTNTFITPVEMFGSKKAGRIGETIHKFDQLESMFDQYADVGVGSQWAEMMGRFVPQVVLTRRLGGAFMTKGAPSAIQAMQAKTATNVATAFSGFQSGSLTARQILDNGGSIGDAWVGGVEGFGSTFLLASGFNKMGLGGVEEFKGGAMSSLPTARTDLMKRLLHARGVKTLYSDSTRVGNIFRGFFGQAAEDGLDTYFNSLILEPYTGESHSDRAFNAVMSMLAGGTMGAATGATQPLSPKRGTAPDATNQEVTAAAEQQMESLARGESVDEAEREAASRRYSELLRLESEITEDGNPRGHTPEERAEVERLQKIMGITRDDGAAPNTTEEDTPTPSEETAPEAEEQPTSPTEEQPPAEESTPTEEQTPTEETTPSEEVVTEDTSVEDSVDGDDVLVEPTLREEMDAMSYAEIKDLAREIIAAIADGATPAEGSPNSVPLNAKGEVIKDFIEANEHILTGEDPAPVATTETEEAPAPEVTTEAVEEQPSPAPSEVTVEDTVTPETPSVTETETGQDTPPPTAPVEETAENTTPEDNVVHRDESGEQIAQEPLVDAEVAETRDVILTSLSDISETGQLSKQQVADLRQRINEAETSQELASIEEGIIDLLVGTDDDFGGSLTESVSVDDFLTDKRTTRAEKQELIERTIEGELQQDIVDDLVQRRLLADEDDSPLFRDDEVIEGLLSEEDVYATYEDPDSSTRLYSFIGIPDPQLVIDVAQSVYKGAKNLAAFAKKMFDLLGSKIRPIVRNLFHDLRRNDGEIKEANLQKVTAEEAFESLTENEKIEHEYLGIDPKSLKNEQENEVAANHAIKVPEMRSRADQEAQSAALHGVHNNWLAHIGLGKGLDLVTLGLTKQNFKNIQDKFFGKAFTNVLFQASVAKARAGFITNQFLSRHRKQMRVTKEGTYRAEDVRPRDPELSLHPSDVMESVEQYGREYYDVSDEFLAYVNDWVSVRNRVLKHFVDSGQKLHFLLDDEGNLDNTKILENYFFPRGRVELVQNPEDSVKFARGGLQHARVSSVERSRSFDTELGGATLTDENGNNIFRYIDTPEERIRNFIEDVYTRIAINDLASHPDIVAQSQPVKYYTDASGKMRIKRYDGDGSFKIGGTTVRLRNSHVKELQKLFNDIDSPPVGVPQAFSHVMNMIRASKFTGDFSTPGVQLVYLGFSRSASSLKAIAMGIPAALNLKSFRDNYLRNNAPIINEIIPYGHMFGGTTESVDFLNQTDSTSGKIRRGGAWLVSPYTRAHTTMIQVGSVEAYKAMRDHAIDKKTNKLDPVKVGKLTQLADRMVGRESLYRNGLSSNHRTWLNILGAAPGMYAAFTNLLTDITSKDPFVAKMSAINHTRFLVGAFMGFGATAFAAMKMDSNDKRSDEDKMKDALLRMIPSSNKFMTADIHVGGGKYVSFSMGGFFRQATKLSAQIRTDPENAHVYIGKFLNTRKSPGVGTALQIATKEDFFGNKVSRLETFLTMFQPITLETLLNDPTTKLVDFISSKSGGRIEGTTYDQLIQEDPSLGQTVGEAFFNMFGYNAYKESERSTFLRQRDQYSKKTYGDVYRDLSFDDKARVMKDYAEKGLEKPRLRTSADFKKYKLDEMESSIGDSTVLRLITERGIEDSLIGIPQYTAPGKWGQPSVEIDSKHKREMTKNFYRNLAVDIKNNREGVRDLPDSELLNHASKLWQIELKRFDYY